MKKVINFYNFQVFSRLKVNWPWLHFYIIQPLAFRLPGYIIQYGHFQIFVGKGKVHGIPLRQITCLSEKRFRELEKVVNKTGGREISKEVIFHILIKKVPKKLLDATKQLHQKPVDAFSGGG